MSRGLGTVPAAGHQEEQDLEAPGKTNTATPCAACRLLRRRCAQDCPFSPYFAPTDPLKFACVHKVFGASNVAKMLMEVPENQRADTATSLVYEAAVRLNNPVYGCVGAISILEKQLQSLEAELNATRAEVLRYKFKEAKTLAHPTFQDCNMPASRPISMAASSSAQPTYQSQLPPLPPAYSPPSHFQQASTRSGQYNTTCRGNIGYFG
ncbi:hypothetical protein SAY87_006832 [Trapa incisa]|uniref:LOB domain-containing protein n=2 Tax=Trapa TaxID=22665 RepID=A0AAN7QQ86_TRANT|nr:hypothetical protein SAY87_006832 [Trapa incisa]KAK4775279.1 hypothetical protein SAY86_010214 [Trapa natans]